MQRNLVSVIMPTYNRKYIIQDAIDSCLEQSYKNIEVIICDDHSTDCTKQYIEERMKQDSRIKYCMTPNGKKGANAARNTAIKMAKGEFLTFLDSDDYLLPNSILDRVKLIQTNNVGMVYGDAIWQSVRGNKKIKIFFTDIRGEKLNQKKYLMQELSLCQQNTMMIRTSVFQKIGLLDEEQKGWTDDEVAVAVGMNYPIMHCKKIVAVVRSSEVSMVGNKWNMYLGCKKMVQRYKRQIIQYVSIGRYILWQIRLFSLYCLAKEREEALGSVRKKYWTNLHLITRKLIWPFFTNHFE